MIKFKKVLRKERQYKNPKTGQESTKDAHYAITITPMTYLKSVINELPIDDVSEDDDKPKKKVSIKKTDEKPKKKASKKKMESDDEAEKSDEDEIELKEDEKSDEDEIELKEAEKSDEEEIEVKEEKPTKKKVSKKTMVVESDDE
jgi:hypothetical protein